MKKIFIIRHIEIEGPGTFGAFLDENNIPYEIVDIYKDRGAALSLLNLESIRGVVILGGPMNVYEEEKYPFLSAEKDFIRRMVAEGIPLMGICLGAQLIASVLGARVRKAPCEEIGWYEMPLEEAAKYDPLLKGFGTSINVFQWHGDTFDLPQEAQLLAKNSGMNQAFRFRDHVWGFQFHLEVDADMIKSWYDEYLKSSQDGSFHEKMLSEYLSFANEFEASAKNLYNRFLSVICVDRT